MCFTPLSFLKDMAQTTAASSAPKLSLDGGGSLIVSPLLKFGINFPNPVEQALQKNVASAESNF